MQYVWYFCEVNNGHYFDNVTELIIWWLKQLCIPIKVISFSLSFKRRVWFNSWFGLFISPFMEITFFFVFQPKQLHPSKMFYTFLRSCLIFLNSISSKAKGYLGKIRIFKNFFQSNFFLNICAHSARLLRKLEKVLFCFESDLYWTENEKCTAMICLDINPSIVY